MFQIAKVHDALLFFSLVIGFVKGDSQFYKVMNERILVFKLLLQNGFINME